MLIVDETFEAKLSTINIEVNFKGFEGAEGSEDFVCALVVEGAASSSCSNVEWGEVEGSEYLVVIF